VSDRFYCPGPWREGLARLEGDEARHLAKVRRVEVGELVVLFDGVGRAASAEVIEIGRDRVELRIADDTSADRALGGPMVLATAVPKGDRFDWLVEKATEIGVTRLVPLLTERSVVDPRSTKIDRLRRLVIEASKQSGRNRLMEIGRPTPLADWLRSPIEGVETRYLAHPSGGRIDDGPRPEITRGIAVAVGPEGGFADNEVEAAVRAGYQIIGLGPTILRIETAALAACVTVLSWSK
jgi:16S rRNA (uracil1498-N3)-methyltransferase